MEYIPNVVSISVTMRFTSKRKSRSLPRPAAIYNVSLKPSPTPLSCVFSNENHKMKLEPDGALPPDLPLR